MPHPLPRVLIKVSSRRPGFFAKPELKFFDTAIDATFSQIGAVVNFSLNAIPQGTGESQRIGRQCTIVRISINYSTTTGSATDFLDGSAQRLIVYLDTQTNGKLPNVVDILDTRDLTSFYNVAKTDQFRILYDKTWNMNQGRGSILTGGISGRLVKFVRWSKKVNIPLEFSGPVPNLQDIRTNNLGILIIRDLGVVDNEFITGKVRVHFIG